jgi:hypothetical protein
MLKYYLCAEQSYRTNAPVCPRPAPPGRLLVQRQHADYYVHCTHIDLYIYAELISNRSSKDASSDWRSLLFAYGAGFVSGLSTAR